jgi:hypothetical protein
LYIDLFNVLIVLFIFFSGALIFFLGGYTVHLYSKKEVIRLENPIEIKATEEDKRTRQIKKDDKEEDRGISFF